MTAAAAMNPYREPGRERVLPSAPDRNDLLVALLSLVVEGGGVVKIAPSSVAPIVRSGIWRMLSDYDSERAPAEYRERYLGSIGDAHFVVEG